ncbi:Arm DNA-binding domain-containing protein [Bradyrhizobium sp. URHC0002]
MHPKCCGSCIAAEASPEPPGKLQSLPDGAHCDGGGLYLRVTGIGGRSWVVNYQWAGKQEKMGIGRLADVSLKKASFKDALVAISQTGQHRESAGLLQG